MKKILFSCSSVVVLFVLLCFAPVTANALNARVEKAIEWAIAIANDNAHGYSQSSRMGPNYDCSSFVCTAFNEAGFPVGSFLDTAAMLEAFPKLGFTLYQKGEVTLQRGDILLRPKTENAGGHTELYLGGDQCVGAVWNYDDRTGDSSGLEIAVRDKENCSYCKNEEYTCILRYNFQSPETTTEDTEEEGKLSRILAAVLATIWIFLG